MGRAIKKRIIITPVIIAALIGASVYGFEPFVKSTLTARLQAALPSFDVSTLPDPKLGIDYIRFEKLALDEDGINTIGALTLTFSLKDLLSGQFNRVIIEDAEIVASTDQDETKLVFDGWLGESGIAGALALRPRSISLKQCDFTFLTESYGGISVSFDATASRQDSDNGASGASKASLPTYNFQARFDSQQRMVSLNGTGLGSFTGKTLSAELEFERGRLRVPSYDITMTRLSGWGRVNYDIASLSIFSELRSGGMRLSALPWKNATMTYNYNNDQTEIYISAQSLGVEGLELAMSVPNDPNQIITKIHAPSEKLWNDYVAANKIEGEDLKNLIDLLSDLNAEIELE